MFAFIGCLLPDLSFNNLIKTKIHYFNFDFFWLRHTLISLIKKIGFCTALAMV